MWLNNPFQILLQFKQNLQFNKKKENIRKKEIIMQDTELLDIKYKTCEFLTQDNNEPCHLNQKLSRVCINEKCLQKCVQLQCINCLRKNHKGHQNISLKQILNQIQQNIVSQEYDQGGEIMISDFFNFIELQKQEVLSTWQKYIQEQRQIQEKIEQQYIEFFDGIKIKAQNKYKFQFKNDIILIKTEIQQNLCETIEEQNQKLKQLLEFDPAIFKQKSQIVPANQLNQKLKKSTDSLKNQIISQEPESLKILNQFQDNLERLIKKNIQEEKFFQQSKLEYLFNTSKKNELKIFEEGIEYQNNASCHKEQVLYSDETFSSGQHGYSMELVNFEKSSSLCFLIGVCEDYKAKDNACTTSGHPWSCLFNNCRGYVGPSNKNFGDVLKNGDTLHIFMDMDNEKYTVTDGNNLLQYSLTPGWPLKGKQLKFFISFLSPELKVRLRILESY